jgi:hypothetical protein
MNATTITTDNGTKGQRVVYWIFTTIIFLADGVGALGFNMPMAVQGVKGLGFTSDWFRWELGLGKIIGALLLVLPFIPVRFKEWAYVGFGISMISAGIGNFYVGDKDHLAGGFMAIVFFIFLLISYIFFHKTYAKGTYKK